jgi:predicted AAA+ superfamily ATPase
MALTNHERVGKSLELLRAGLGPFIERELANAHGDGARTAATAFVGEDRLAGKKPIADWDASLLLKLMWEAWNDIFRKTLGHSERSLVSELRDVRNRWAHQSTFSSDDAYRGLDSAHRLLLAVSAPQADDLDKLKNELLRVRFDDQMRTERRKSVGTTVESQVTGSLKPWREVVTPHADVASGRYQQAEFAADLWQVHVGEGSDEYRDPAEFFRRTFLTESLKRLLVGAVQRLTGGGGDPVVQLQTNFGGGKTHSMLALYHLVSGTPHGELVGIDAILSEAGAKALPRANRVVLVGNKISPGNPSKKRDGTVVRTLWGELAWQLGGKKAFERIRADDENATSPGDVIRELFNEYGPSLVLIDEWVAYARQLHDQSDLPGGGFETQFSFAQVLTESAKLAKNCLLVISLPASDLAASPHAQADDVEVGGQRGREALARLRNVIGRVETSWRPASAEEGFEIVRRRLFQPMLDREQFAARDLVAREFADFYRQQRQEFPPEASDVEYEKRLKAAYPIHPEVFDRLYNDWSTLVKFQRTRGVLRLMAAVIHSLWEKGDRNPLIMPSNVPIDDPRVQFELTRYLSDSWVPIIEKDIDGPNSLPLRIDGDQPNLGKLAACRRVARTIYLGSAPIAEAANRGLEDRRVRLGCVMPGEAPAVFGDALRRLASAATYLYQDGPRYWYSTQATVTKLAEDRAEQYKRDPDKVIQEIEARIRAEVKDPKRLGDFSRVHPLPSSSQEVPDDLDARLVILSTDHPYTKDGVSAAEIEAKAILRTRGSSPRLYANTLVFLAVDKTRLQDLDEAVRKFIAWRSILDEKDTLNLDPHQVRQAETQRSAADSAVVARLPEAYQWLLVPTQATPQSTVEWQAIRLTGSDALAVRASKKLRSDESLITSFAASRLRMELDRIPLWRGNHVAVKQLIDDFGRFHYLPRLRSPAVLLGAVADGLGSLMWLRDAFAYADSFDDAEGRYRGLRAGQRLTVGEDGGDGLLVKPEAAGAQLATEEAARLASASTGSSGAGLGGTIAGRPGHDVGDGEGRTRGDGSPFTGGPAVSVRPKRFHGAVSLNPTRAGLDASKIAEEVIGHLAGLVGSRVRVTLEIEAEIPGGAPEHVVRTVTENAKTLKFTDQGFEVE